MHRTISASITSGEFVTGRSFQLARSSWGRCGVHGAGVEFMGPVWSSWGRCGVHGAGVEFMGYAPPVPPSVRVPAVRVPAVRVLDRPGAAQSAFVPASPNLTVENRISPAAALPAGCRPARTGAPRPGGAASAPWPARPPHTPSASPRLRRPQVRGRRQAGH